MFMTLLSVLIGLVLADLVSEVRTRLVLWPLNMNTARTWGQVLGHASTCVTSWVVYVHIGVSQERLPSLSDSLVAFIGPIMLLFVMPLIGNELIWPWLYFASGSIVILFGTNLWLLHLSRAQYQFVQLKRLLRANGYFTIYYVGALIYGAAGWLDQQGYLSLTYEVILTITPLPTTLFAANLFLRAWRQSIEESEPLNSTTDFEAHISPFENLPPTGTEGS